MDFKFPELSTDKKVTWIAHIDNKTEKDKALYDMIIGMDMLVELGLYINTDEKTVCWDSTRILLKERGELQDANVMKMLYHIVIERPNLEQAEERQSCILDADYSAVDIDDYVNHQQHLSGDEKHALKERLKKHPELFSGGLGMLNMKPIHLELEYGMVPYHC